MRSRTLTAILGSTLLVAAPQAFAFGPHGGPGLFGGGGPGGAGGPGGPGGMPLRLLVTQLNPEQRVQVRRILLADRGTMRDTLGQLRKAHDALADKMFAAGNVSQADLEPLMKKIGALHQQIVEHGAQVMLKVRAVATPEQLAKAAAAKQKVDKLREEMGTLLGKSVPDDDEPGE